MKYHVIYDGNCNLCVNLVQLLESFDQGKSFVYTPMQNESSWFDGSECLWLWKGHDFDW